MASYKSITPSAFINGINKGQAFTPPFKVEGLSPNDVPGFHTWKNSPDPDKLNGSHMGTWYVWPPNPVTSNPWTAFTGGILFEKWRYSFDRQTIDLYVSDGAPSGTAIIIGNYEGRKVIKNPSTSIYANKYIYGPEYTVQLRLEFKIAENIPVPTAPPSVRMEAPSGSYARPESGSKHIGNIEISVDLRQGEQLVSASVQMRGPSPRPLLGTESTSSDTVNIPVTLKSNTALGVYNMTATIETKAGTKTWTATATPSGGALEVTRPGSPDIPDPDPGPGPDPGPDPDPLPPPPEPVVKDKWVLQRSVSTTIAVSKPNGEVQWVTTTTVGNE